LLLQPHIDRNFFLQTFPQKISLKLALKNSIAFMIAVENLIRIKLTFIFHFSPGI